MSSKIYAINYLECFPLPGGISLRVVINSGVTYLVDSSDVRSAVNKHLYGVLVSMPGRH
jgi:hypothetical protein